MIDEIAQEIIRMANHDLAVRERLLAEGILFDVKTDSDSQKWRRKAGWL
ncbi:hypothetical protein [Spirosoma flavus]